MTKNDNKVFGIYIKMLRQRKGLSLKAMSEKSDISTAYLSRLENCKRIYPSIEVLKKLSTALEVTFMDLLMVSLTVDKSDSKELLEILLSYDYKIMGKDVSNEAKMELTEVINYIIDDRWMDIDGYNKYSKDLLIRIKQLNELLKR